MHIYKYVQSHVIILHQPVSVTLVTIIRVSNNMQFNTLINVQLLVHHISIYHSLMQGYGTHKVYWMKCQQLTEFMSKSVINSFDKTFTIPVTWIHQWQLCHKQALCSNTSPKHSKKKLLRILPSHEQIHYSNTSTLHPCTECSGYSLFTLHWFLLSYKVPGDQPLFSRL
jgi:hypothetical protein